MTDYPKDMTHADSAADAPILDIEDGVRRFAGNRAIYLKLLGKFGELNKSFLPDLMDAVEKRDKEAYIRHLHSMKGAAGNVSATALFHLSRDLEMEARNNPDLDPETLVPRIKPVLEALLTEIDRISAT